MQVAAREAFVEHSEEGFVTCSSTFHTISRELHVTAPHRCPAGPSGDVTERSFLELSAGV